MFRVRGIGSVGIGILFKVVLVSEGMIDNLALMLVRNAKEKVSTVEGRHIADDSIKKWTNGKSDGTSLRNHETRAILMDPTQLIRSWVRGSRESKSLGLELRSFLTPII